MPVILKHVINQLHSISANFSSAEIGLSVAVTGVLAYGSLKYIDSILIQFRNYFIGNLIDTIKHKIGMLSYNKINTVNVIFYMDCFHRI